MSAKHNPTPEQEARWEKEKNAYYETWRENKLRSCAKYIEDARNGRDRHNRILAIKEALGRPGVDFMTELMSRLRDAK